MIDTLKAYLNDFKLFNTELTLGELNAIESLKIHDGTVYLHILLGFPAKEFQTSLKKSLIEYLQTKTSLNIDISIQWKIVAHTVQTGLAPHPQIKNIIAVGSGKGGVGKSTTAVNLALALYREGAEVGLLDADIYGPNQPQMLGLMQRPETSDNKTIEPIIAHGLQSMSIGYLVNADAPMVWRGPMVSGALTQLLNDTHWKNLDYLVIDLPPGTGDVQLTLAQKIPVSGAVIVTTPQDVALLDVRKAINMFNKVNIPILGVIENMSTHICAQCHLEEPIFGEGGGLLIAEQYGIPRLGSLPLSMNIRVQADKGTPIVIADETHPASLQYMQIARHLSARLSILPKSFKSKFPKIEIQDR
jgi:ATP-binding protein involved in chromosome partitioning